MFGSSVNSPVVLYGLDSGNYLRTFRSRSDERPVLDSCMNDISLEEDFEKQVSELTVNNDTVVVSSANFLNCFWSVLQLLNIQTLHVEYALSVYPLYESEIINEIIIRNITLLK